MANGNPFFVQPMGDITQGLQGLGGALLQANQLRKQRQMMEKRQSEEKEIGTIFELLQSPEKTQEIITTTEGPEAGRILDIYNRDPEAFKKTLEQRLAFMAPKRYESYRKTMKDVSKAKEAKMQKTGAFLVRDPETNQVGITTGVFDPNKGTLTTETAELPGYQVVSKLGETAREQTERRVGETERKATVKGQESRANELITRGINAAESTAILRRGIDLLDDVKTGGFTNVVRLRAKQFFGVEGADEGELSANLGKAVLSQLRETFGAAFTENEGKRLERIEANFGKSPGTNKRLLNQALRISERTAKRAMEAARKRGDQETVDDINDLLTFDLGLQEGAEPEPDTTATDYTQMSTDELMRRRNELLGQRGQ